jgi:hypothetical protein
MVTGQPGAAVAATTGRARIHGLEKGAGATNDDNDIHINIVFTE